jgi:hypothetical protein
MVTSELGVLLDELGRAINIPNLRPDSQETCLIRLKNGAEVQLEIDRSGNSLLMGMDIGEVPLGRFRQDIFEAALKANKDSHRQGIFAWSTKTEHLVLFTYLSLKDLNGLKISDHLGPFAEKARLWKDSISRNEIPTAAGGVVSSKRGIFGLMP